jgi:hypothetical protein
VVLVMQPSGHRRSRAFVNEEFHRAGSAAKGMKAVSFNALVTNRKQARISSSSIPLYSLRMSCSVAPSPGDSAHIQHSSASLE